LRGVNHGGTFAGDSGGKNQIGGDLFVIQPSSPGKVPCSRSFWGHKKGDRGG